MIVSKWVLTTALLLGLPLFGQRGFAQAPSGSITNQITGTTNALWDASLLWTDITTNTWAGNIALLGAKATNDAVRVSFSGAYILDGRGRLVGNDTNELMLTRLALAAEITTNQVPLTTTNLFNQVVTTFIEQVVTNWNWADVQDLGTIPGKYSARGSVLGLRGIAVVKFSNRASGQLQEGSVTRRVSATKVIQVIIRPDGSLIRGSYGNIISISGKPTYVAGGPFVNFNPFYSAFGGGAWTLVLNFDPPSTNANNRITGTATATLSSGSVYPFQLTGRYIPTKAQSQLLLKGVKNSTGDADARGATLSLTLSTNSQIVQMLGRIAGQAISQK